MNRLTCKTCGSNEHWAWCPDGDDERLPEILQEMAIGARMPRLVLKHAAEEILRLRSEVQRLEQQNQEAVDQVRYLFEQLVRTGNTEYVELRADNNR